jgi:predicted ATP-grasp superfamily ATP-dependent carboligase
MTYCVKTDSEEFTNAMKEELEKYGMKESSNFPVDFVFFSGKSEYYKNRINLKKSLLTNLIQYPSITDKSKLYEKFKGESFIKDSITITDKIPELPSSFLKILKPVDGFSGKDIRIVQTREEIEEWMNKYKHPKWVLQEYIKESALIDGEKFHLRVFILVIDTRVYVCNKSVFVTSDYTQYYPETLPDGWKRKTEIKDIFKIVLKDIKLKPDWNSKNSYYIFGADVMFEKRKPILIEINKKPGLVAKELLYIIPELIKTLFNKKSLFEQIL